MNEYDQFITPASEYDAQLQIEGDGAKQRLRASMVPALKQDPDQYGKAKQLERQTGIPAPVAARNLPDVQQRANLNEYDQLLGTKTGDALQNPDFANLAHDDTANLFGIEGQLKPQGKPVITNSEFSDLVQEIKRKNPVVDWDEARHIAMQQADVVPDGTPMVGPIKGPRASIGTVMSGLWQSLLSGGEKARQGARYQFADAIGSEAMQADALKKYQRANFENDIVTPEMDATGKLLYGGASNVVQNIPILAAAIAMRNPTLAAGLAAVQAETQAYPKYRERGGTPGEAALGAGIEGTIEFATEKIPLSFLTENFGKIPLWQLFVGDQVREQITEQIATHGQDLTDTLIANPNATIADYLKGRPDAALQTAVAVLMQGVVLGGAHAAATKMAGKTEASMQAEQDAKRLQVLSELAKASKVRERDPQSFAAFVDAAAADGPVQNVYVDARALMQAAGDALPEIVRSTPSLAAQIDEALKAGGDVRIPIGEYAASIAASDVNATLMPHLRTSPEGMSMEEAKTFMQGQAEEFKAEAEKILADKQFNAAHEESAATVEKELLTQLNAANRFTPDVNAAYAKLQAAFFKVTAARLGITPEEMYVRYPLNAAAAAPGGVVGLDQSDRTIQIDDGTRRPTADSEGRALGSTFSEQKAFWRWYGNAPVDAAGKPVAVNGHYTNEKGETKPANGALQQSVQRGLANAKDSANAADNGGMNTLKQETIDNATGALNEAPPFYSQLSRLLETAKINTAPAEQWASFIKGLSSKGVKKEEIEMSGVLDWLDTQKDGRVTKEQVLDYLAENGTKVETILLGEPKKVGTDLVASQDTEDNEPSESAVEELAYEMWQNDADSRWQGHLEYARESEYVQYEVKLVLPTYRVVELPADLLRDEPRFGIKEIDYGDTSKITDVAELNEPTEKWVSDGRASGGTPQDFPDEKTAEGYITEQLMRGETQVDDPHFVGNFAEAEKTTDEHDTKAEAESDASRMQDRMVEQEAQFQAENEDYGDDSHYYEELAREQLTEEMQNPRLRSNGGDVPRLRHENQWQSNGGRQYREMILSVPNIEPYNSGDSTHFATDTGGRTVAWSRFKIHDDANGVPTMFVEEIQSQRAQHGKEKGFKGKALAPGSFDSVFEKRGDKWVLRSDGTVWFDTETEARNFLDEKRRGDLVPVAPFVQETQAWTALTLKRLLRYAVDNGITQIAWTTGAENAVRYGTSSQIDSLKWSKVEGGIQVEAVKDGKVVIDKKLEAQTELGRTIGNRVATTIINDPSQSGEIPATDLDSINGLGMQTFYGDVEGLDPKGKPAIVPLVADKLSKTLGGAGVKKIDLTVSEKGQMFAGAAGFEITPEMAAKIKGGLPLFQKQQGGARGLISFGDSINQPSTITLLAGADLSTFLHESGHFYLEVLTDIAAQPDAPKEVVDDMNKLLAWFAPGLTLPTWQAMSIDQKRAYHEQFARGFEAYLFEGRAPNQELAGLFARFRAWLINVYRHLTALKVELTDEVRGVMDRLIATNEQILAAEAARNYAPLFKSAEEAGMTADEWVSYQELGQQATQDGVDMLQRRSLRDMQWLTNARSRTLKKLQKLAATRRDGIEREVTAEVRQEPVYAAQRFLRYGELPDADRTNAERKVLDSMAGEVPKLSLPDLKEMYGEDPAAPWRYLAVGKNGLAATEGVNPNLIAELFGFTSGDHLVRAILAAAPEASEIEGKTDQRMLERYGDLSSPDAISKATDEAIHNEARTKFVATELRSLAKATGQKNILAKAAKEFAASIIARKKVSDVRPAQYAAAEARAAKAAEKAIIGGNLVEAATEKRNQLVNNYATRAAYEAVNEIEKGVRYLKKVGDSKTVDPEYREQIDAMLERFDLRQVTQKDLARRQSLLEWVDTQRERGFEPTISAELLNEARRQNYREMTVEEFRGLVDAVKNIEHLGRLKHKLLTAKDEREFVVRVDEAATSIIDNAKKTVPVKLESNTWADKMKSGVTEFFAMHRKLASMLREMDGFKDAGALWELIGRPMNEAGNREAVMREEATIKLVELFKPLSKLKEKVFIPEINASLSREGRIMVALNTGNEGNLQRLMDGDHWAPAQVRAILNTLTKEEMDFVQNVWDLVGSYRSEIGAQQKRLTGIEPEWVEATPVETKHGTYKGGYIPAKYDTNRSTRSLSDEAAQGVFDQWRAKRGFAKTRDSFTKGRADKVVDRPLRKDFGVITQHVTEVTHRLAWQEFLVDASRLLRAAPIDNAIRDHYGPEALKAMRDTVEDIAAGEVGAQNAFESALNYLRTGATIAGLGWRVTTSLLQPLGLTQSMVRIGPKYVAQGLAEWIGDAAKMENTAKRIYEKSDFMRLRGKTMQREISEIRNTVAGRSSAIEASYFYLIQKMQLVADIPTWLGQYRKSVESGADEAKAVAQADQAVIDSQGSGQIKDLAKVQRAGPFWKMFTNFYSYFNVLHNMTAESVGRTDFKNPLSVGRLAVDMLLLYSVPAALGTLLKAALHGDLDDEDKLARRLISDQLTYLFGTMVGLREFAGTVQTALGLPGDYQGPASVRVVAEVAKLGKQAGQGEVDEAFLKALDNVGGILFHYPAGQVNATADGLYKLATGQTENPGALLVGAK